MTVPIAISPGRLGFGPQLSLLYDSGAGNGSFGFGWALSQPAITRKTDKGLPQYRDGEESDVFVLSGAEDLVPVLESDGTRFEDLNTAPGYTIHRYRPRIEGLFARIERWTRRVNGEVHWRSISRDNILTVYGKDENSRISDPRDPRRTFSWLICETRDDRGNAVLYEYKPEDGAGVDLTCAHERNRGDRDDIRRKANRHLKRIRYGNRMPLLDGTGRRPRLLNAVQVQNARWMFEVVLDYGEHDVDAPKPNDSDEWTYRTDPFSSYRAGFELRNCRLCQRFLMFHHVEGEDNVGRDCLVRSTDFTYSYEADPANARNPVYTFLRAVTQVGYRRHNAGYLKRSVPPVEFEYTQPTVRRAVRDVDAASLENLPIGVDGATYRWTDLHGEGISGILTEQAGAWFYKPNISPISERPVEFAPLIRVATKPSRAIVGGQANFMDLAGDGQPDLVVLDGSMPGLYENDGDEGWKPFRPFTSRLNRDTRDPNLRFVDLDGDGRTDVLITEGDALVWHRSLGEKGFGSASHVHQALDEEKGPRLMFTDGTESVYLADLSGDGLADLVRIRRSEIVYHPNLGNGHFGAKVTMDRAPRFDDQDQFDHKRIRLADIDGTGTTDIIYLHRDGVRLYFNQSGNSWSAPHQLNVLAQVDDLATVTPTDLFGNGTACLVWSSPLPGDARRQMRYVALMEQKPHLLVKAINNLGSETCITYASSTKFYLQDKRDGRPWITRLPFPVHVVERVETYDRISRNLFISLYAYHHGYWATEGEGGGEREFRGFGMVEQWDTEARATLGQSDSFPVGDNIDATSHVPPVYTKTWFHTGVYLGRDRVSAFFAGLLDAHDRGEYYREPGVTDDQARELLLADTVLPIGLTLEEEREACRALKGSMLRREVYALDGRPKAEHPYTVTEQNFAIHRLQPRGNNRHTVLFTHARDTLTYHYERTPADPRVQHAMTLEVDEFGNVLKETTIGYGRRQADASLPLEADREAQIRTLITYTENGVTNAIDDLTAYPDDYRTPLPCETLTYELTGFTPTGEAGRYEHADLVRPDPNVPGRLAIRGGEIHYEDAPTHGKQRRLIEHVRTLYRNDMLTTLLELGKLEPLALAGEGYKLAFTPGLLDQVYVRGGQKLLPADPANVLKGTDSGGGGYILSQDWKSAGLFPHTDPDDHWWIPAGRVFLSPGSNDSPAQELAHARRHFFLPQRYRDPFHTNAVNTESFVRYDAYDMLTVETRDALGNRVTAGERLPDGNLDASKPGNDYRVLQPRQVMDPNRNRTQVTFDSLGMVVGTAVLGKPEENLGDSLDGFEADLTEAVALDHLANPLADPLAILRRASTRLVYDLFAYQRTQGQTNPQSPVVYTLARETHDADLQAGERTKVQHSFSYSDGFGREIQRKTQAEPERTNGVTGPPRWVGSGWTIFNNKGKPVRQYEPFFSPTHGFEFGVQVGVSAVKFYDPVDRVIATLQPNDTYEKVIFDPWRQVTWDVNDTVLSDPRTDPDIRGLTQGYFAALPPTPGGWQTWHAQRHGGALGTQQQAAAAKAAAHADTPTTVHFDTLGRPFLTQSDNGPNPAMPGEHLLFATRVDLDIEGNQRAVRDAIELAGDQRGRIVMRYVYDLLGNRIHQLSMEAGRRWMLNDVAGKSIRTWDSRGYSGRTEYDPLRRPLRSFITGVDAADGNREILTERMVYGEQHPEDQMRNLRARLYLHLDQSGAISTEAHDFKGNPLRASRRIGSDYKKAIDWNAADAALPAGAAAALNTGVLEAVLALQLEPDNYINGTTYDALNRPTSLTTPHTAAMQPSVVRSSYNEANLLDRVDANLYGTTVSGQPMWTPFVTNIDYDARGQRQRIDYGNGATTFYDYDQLTFRLVNLLTKRNAVAFPADCPQPQATDWKGCQVQNLHYTYDPVGNVTYIQDDAQQTVYFRNRRVEPSAEYTYDPIYRLIQATGREHLGQVGGAPIAHSHNDAPRVGIDWSANDGNALGRYTERYVYDAVGNFLEMQHRGTDPVHPGWTRRYAYGETSLIEDGVGGTPVKTNNRLSGTAVGNNIAPLERYGYDAHGNMTRMPHLGGAHPVSNMQWGYRDELRQVDLGGGGNAYYVYDATGQRVRKVWEKSANLVEERLYLGGFEMFRRRQGAERLERETLHIMDDKQRIALVEERTRDTAASDRATQRLIRYQFGNHLGSVSLELTDEAKLISYEEYTPYGSTSYQAVRNRAETPKRYRYTGKERDEESGLHYHGARYYASWLGKWTRCDPLGVVDGACLYAYARNNPLRFSDSTGGLSWDPAAWGDAIDERISTVEQAVLAEDANVRTSLWNTAVTTTSTMVKGSTSILRVGTGAAQGFQDVKRGLSDKGDAWDFAIGLSRMLGDAGEVASAALGVAGSVAKAANVAKIASVSRELKEARAAGRSAEVIGELETRKMALKAGLQPAGSMKRKPLSGQSTEVAQGIDQAYLGTRRPFTKDKAYRATLIEAKGRSKSLPKAEGSLMNNVLDVDTSGLTQGTPSWNIDRLNSGSIRAQAIGDLVENGRAELESLVVTARREKEVTRVWEMTDTSAQHLSQIRPDETATDLVKTYVNLTAVRETVKQ